jgi:hypothetical protein
MRFALVLLLLMGVTFVTRHWQPKTPGSVGQPDGLGTAEAVPEPAKSSVRFGNAPTYSDHGTRSNFPISLITKAVDAPVWAVPFGAEFWRGHLSTLEIGLGQRATAQGISPQRLAGAIERVSSAFELVSGGAAAEASGKGYRARIDTEGLSLLPLARKVGAPAIRFDTRRISRGSQELFSGGTEPSTWTVSGNTAQGLLSLDSGVVEHYEARMNGVEVAWVLSKPPVGDGDLCIEAAMSGSEVYSFDRDANRVATPRVKVGQAQAVDSRGRTWPLALQVAENRVRVEVPAQVLAEAAYPLAVDPLLTPEFSLDAAVAGPSPSTRSAPVVAVNESGYLVVWSQGKTEIADAGVFAARIDSAGVLLDPYGFSVSPIAAEQTVCSVAANANHFLVTWAAPHGTSLTDWDIFGARIRPSGAVLDPTPLPICTLTSLQNSPAVAGNGDNFLVVWRDSRTTGIYGALVATNGVISPTNGLSVLNGSNDQYTPAVAACGTNYLVVVQDYRKGSSSAYNSDIYGARVSGGGAVLDLAGFIISTNAGSQFRPAAASDGTNYLVVWQDYDVGGNDIRAARVSPSGAVLEMNGFPVCHAFNTQASPAVSGGAGGFLVAWQDFRDSGTNNYEARTYAARVQGDGSVLDPNGVSLSLSDGGQCVPAVAMREGNWLVVWQDFRNNPGTMLSDVYGVSGSWSNPLTVGPEGLISGAGNVELSPAAAALGTNYLVVWADNRHAASNDWDICGVRLDADGALLDSSPLWICTATHRQLDPTVTAGETNFLVAWSDWRNASITNQQADVFGTVVSADGTVQQPLGIAICTLTNDQALPSAARLGTNFFVVWQDARLALPTAPRMDVYGARVTSGGALLDPTGIAICAHSAIQTNPVVAAAASQVLVVWTDYRLSTVYPDVFGNRVTAEGTVMDTNGFSISTVAASSQYLPAVASDGLDFLVAWTDTRAASTAPDIYGTRVSAGGAVSPAAGFAIRNLAGPQTAPAAAFNGLDYLVTWQEARSSGSSAFDIYALQIDPRGQSGPLFAINSNLDVQLAPTLAAGADGRFLTAYQTSLMPGAHTMANLLHSELVPRLNASSSLVDGTFQFRFRGAVGERYLIETSSDLLRWTPFLSFTNLAPDQLISDVATTNIPARFYRATLLP